MKSKIPRWIPALLMLGMIGGAAGVWALLHPAAFWLKPWRPAPEVVGSRFIFGPYPVEADFQALQAQGVTTVISLLDADLPYEAVLLTEEKERAERYGMRVLNFPMASILGQSFGKDYLANSEAAAKAALESPGVVYVHCYVGLHRSARVREILEAEGSATTLREGTLKHGRSPDTLALDRANFAFMENRLPDALAELAKIQQKEPAAKLLEAWVNYRLGRIAEARKLFSEVVSARPDTMDAVNGLGFCALRDNDLDEAERQFTAVLDRSPEDISAIEGLAHVKYRRGQRTEARALFTRVLEHNPGNGEVQGILAKLKAAQRHVVLIVVDGLLPAALTAATAPNITRLTTTSAATLTARAVGKTDSLPSIATIVTGVLPEAHGVDSDSFTGSKVKAPTLFERVHEAGGRNALYIGKRSLAFLAPEELTASRHGAGVDGVAWSAGTSVTLAEIFAGEFRKQQFEFTLLHLRDPDVAGHRNGWNSPEYFVGVADADAAVGTILQAVADSGLAEQTTVMLMADHGGAGTRHSPAAKASWVVPFLCHRPDLKQGPIGGSVTLLDVAPTVLALLNLPPLPQAAGQPVAACLPGGG